MSQPPEPATADDETATEPTAGGPESSRWRTSRLVPVAIVAVAIAVIAVIVIVARNDQDQGATALANGSVDASTLPVTIPYRTVDGAIVIDVGLGEGSRTVPMILDTGAPTIISEDVARTFAGDQVGTIASASVDGQVDTSSVVVLPALDIGGARFTDVGAVVGAIEPGDPFYCISEAGFIGTSTLRTAVWRIDPRSHELTIAADPGQLPDPGSAIRLDFEPASAISPSPLVELAGSEGSLAAVIDTGWDGWIAVNLDDLEAAGMTIGDDPPTRSVLGHGSGGPFTSRVRWTAGELAIGGEPLAPPDAALPIATSESLAPGLGLVGTDFLSHFIVTIDWTSDSLYLEPIDDELRPAAPMSASLGWSDGLVVGSYVEGAEGTQGLELGTPVAAIDGRDTTGAPFDEFCSYASDDGAIHQVVTDDDPPTIVEMAPVVGFYADLAAP